MAYIIIIILSTVIAASVAGLVEKKRLNEIEKNKKNVTITYDKYFIGAIGCILVLILVAIIGMLVALFGFGAYGNEEGRSFIGLLLGLAVFGIMYAIAFINLKSWKISLNENELIHKKLFSTVEISYDELRILTMDNKIIVEKIFLKIPGPNGYIKVNQVRTSSGTNFKDVIMEKVGLDDSAFSMVGSD